MGIDNISLLGLICKITKPIVILYELNLQIGRVAGLFDYIYRWWNVFVYNNFKFKKTKPANKDGIQ